MRNSPWQIFLCSLLLALAVNICLFALIPHLAQQQAPRELPLILQQVQLFREQPQEPAVEEEKAVVEEKPPEPMQNLQPIVPQQLQLIQAPDLKLSVPQPTLQMAPAYTPVPVSALNDSYRVEDLDKAPMLNYQAPPHYPYRARRMNISGHVKLQFDVRLDGTVGQLKILESVPPGVFDDAVLEAAKKWRYQPGELMGGQVITRMTRTIVFNLEE